MSHANAREITTYMTAKCEELNHIIARKDATQEVISMSNYIKVLFEKISSSIFF